MIVEIAMLTVDSDVSICSAARCVGVDLRVVSAEFLEVHPVSTQFLAKHTCCG